MNKKVSKTHETKSAAEKMSIPRGGNFYKKFNIKINIIRFFITFIS